MTGHLSKRDVARLRRRGLPGLPSSASFNAAPMHKARLRVSLSESEKQADPLAAAHLSNTRDRGDVSASYVNPPSLTALFRRAVDAQQTGRLPEAEALYRGILAIDKSHAMVWSNLAVILIEQRRSGEAIAACRSALALVPDHLNAQLNLATALQQKRDYVEAARTYRGLLARHPHRPDLWKNLGTVLERAGRLAEAIEAYDTLIAIEPGEPNGHEMKAEALYKIGRVEEAIACFADVLRLKPDDAVSLSSMGILIATHSIENDLDAAAAHCVKAAILMPDNAAIINNLAIVLNIRKDTDKAFLLLHQLLLQQPGYAPAYSNLGSMLSSKGRYDEAEDAFLKALELDASRQEAETELAKVRRHLCNWRHYDADRAAIKAPQVLGTNYMITLMAVSASGQEQLDYARSTMAKYNALRVRVGPYRNAFNGRLRIGYISADFREHPIGRLVPELIARHDRARFEVFGYALGESEMTPLRYRLACSFDHFIDCRKMSDVEVASRVLRDGIDILVDLTGPTAGARFGIMVQRPAPVQVSFLGLPGTCGADCIDYIVADRFLVPDGHDAFYHENVVRLPDCYQPSDTSRKLMDPLPSRTDLGLPEHGFVFCSYNSPVKMTPEVFAIWMRLLHAIEGSVLWLFCKAEKTKVNLLAEAERAGIPAERIIFAGHAPFDLYLARMVRADLFLDTFPYAAGATCNDALWAGLPVLTCVGETYVSRMAGSLLSTMGLDELVTRSLADYERVALDLATDTGKLKRLRDRLAAERNSGPLFDMARFTVSLETAYDRMAGIAAAGGAPAGFDVAPPG